MNDLISGVTGEYKTYFVIFCLVMFFLRQPSISFFTGLILRLFRINYTDKQYEEYDNKIYNQQLLRLKRGVKTSSAEDAKLISDALSDGVIEQSMFRFTSFFGPVGVRRTIRIQNIGVIVIGVLFIASALTIIYDMPYMKSGYVTYNSDSGEKLYISKHRVYDQKNNVSYNKSDCVRISKISETSQQLKDTCNYIITTDPDLRSELYSAIESEKQAMITLCILVLSLLGGGYWLIVGFNNYIKINKLVCDLKRMK